MSVQFLATHDSEAKSSHEDAIWGVKWTAKDEVVSIGADGGLKVWDPTGTLKHSAPSHPLGLVSLSVPPSGNSVLTNAIDGTTSLYSLSDLSLIGKHESFLGKPFEGKSVATSWTVAMHPGEGSFASSGAGGRVYVRDAKASETGGEEGEGFGEEMRAMDTGKGKFGMNLQYSPDGRSLALSSETGQVFVFDVESGSLGATYSSHNVCVRALSWSPDSQFLYSGSDDKTIILHDVRTSSRGSSAVGPGSGPISTLTGHTSWVLSLDGSPDGRLLLSGSADKSVKLWDVRAGGGGGTKGGCVGTFGSDGEVWGVGWRPMEADQKEVGKKFVSGGDEKVVKWWRAAGV